MRQLALVLLLSVAATTSSAAECQNLAGKFFYSNNPSQTVVIEQTACVLTMTYENSGNVGKPVIHSGDGVWNVIRDGKYERETQASFAFADSYRVETKSVVKNSKEEFHLIETYKLRADGNITLYSTITSGDISDNATRLMIRE